MKLDLEVYVPGYFTSIANKLSNGASRDYLRTFAIGIEAWRAIAIIASYGEATATEICQFSGMDKGPVSRTMKSLLNKKLIEYRQDPLDARVRIAKLSSKGERLHEKILAYALHREATLLSVLTPAEQKQLVNFLHRMRLNLGRVDSMSAEFVQTHWQNENLRKEFEGDE